MVMETSSTKPYSVVSEFEGTFLKNEELFSYFMLLAFDASALIRFAVLLFFWPIITLLDVLGYKNTALKLMIFVAIVGLRESEIEPVAKAVLPKFYMDEDDLSMDTWMVFSSCKKRVVVTRMPRVMVEWFAKEHLNADEVIGTELIVNRFGFLTGLVHEVDIDKSNMNRVTNLFVDRKPYLGIGRHSTTFISLCEEQIYAPADWNHLNQQLEVQPPKPVIFHAARLVKRPTPTMALFILIWIPFGIILAAIRILGGYVLPMWAIPYVIGISGMRVIVKGKPPTGDSDGLLFVCNHRTTIDPAVISYALGRSISAVTLCNISRLYNILTPIPLVKFTRIREIDAEKMKQELSKGDLLLCPEGTLCFQPFVLRFSALFAELTDRIVPVAINCRVGFFQNPVRRWDSLDVIVLFLNPRPVYEVTFLNQLPIEETYSSGKSPHYVANHVQKLVAATLGFQCTNLGRKDKYLIVKPSH